MKTAIWWLRRDLRLMDNQALGEALSFADQLLPVFILDPVLLDSGYVGEKRTSFLYACLADLDHHLRLRESALILRAGNPELVLQSLVKEVGAAMIFAEQDVSPYAVRRDARAAHSLPMRWVGFPSVYPPGSVKKADGAPYTVFTPFSKAWKALPLPTAISSEAPEKIATPANVHSLPLPTPPAIDHPLSFPPGESEALRRLEAFCSGVDAPVYRYGEQRNALDEPGTSALSPYLRFGLLSARRAAAAALSALRDAPSPAAQRSAETWLNELIWRDFYLHILYHFPNARQESFRPELRAVRWDNDPALFSAWCDGQTGYPVVDAAMRELRQTGWMHNRARMIVASFLTKDLHIDWRWGEKWFMQHLVDGDPAANNGGWQWTAGTGTDAAPYFRIFNPVMQGMKFDPQGDYIRRWVKELMWVPLEYIHAPWKMPLELQARAQCVIGSDYPKPVVDHQLARQKTLELYGASKR
jgi:deoxyribodipyrimidine photo-lyase